MKLEGTLRTVRKTAIILILGGGLLIEGLPSAAQSSDVNRKDKTIALVIGNSDYDNIKDLRNPKNDAEAIAKKLQELGFDEVYPYRNLKQKDMKRAIRDFGIRLRAVGDDGVGLFFYAGHGVQIKGDNYLIPTDAEIAVPSDVSIEAVLANDVLVTMEGARNRLNLVILDACRNNPFPISAFRNLAPKGLAKMDAARGTLIAYSTSPNQVAEDGTGQNSPYTSALLTAMSEPGVPVELMFKNVRKKVVKITRNQTPWEASSLTGDFFFNPTEKIEVTDEGSSVPVQPIGGENTASAVETQQMQNDFEVEIQFWKSIQSSHIAEEYHAYLDAFPNGKYVGLAKVRIGNLERAQKAAREEERKRQAEAEATRQTALEEERRLKAVRAEVARQRQQEEAAREEAKRQRLAAERERQAEVAAAAERQRLTKIREAREAARKTALCLQRAEDSGAHPTEIVRRKNRC